MFPFTIPNTYSRSVGFLTQFPAILSWVLWRTGQVCLHTCFSTPAKCPAFSNNLVRCWNHTKTFHLAPALFEMRNSTILSYFSQQDCSCTTSTANEVFIPTFCQPCWSESLELPDQRRAKGMAVTSMTGAPVFLASPCPVICQFPKHTWVRWSINPENREGGDRGVSQRSSNIRKLPFEMKGNRSQRKYSECNQYWAFFFFICTIHDI